MSQVITSIPAKAPRWRPLFAAYPAVRRGDDHVSQVAVGHMADYNAVSLSGVFGKCARACDLHIVRVAPKN